MIVLDTHAWIWWMNDTDRLRSEVRNLIDSSPQVHISAISLMEVATAAVRGRVILTPSIEEWFVDANVIQSLRVNPLTERLCIAAARLADGFHGDPADRLIVALARQLDVPLVTADHRILAYPHVQTVAAD